MCVYGAFLQGRPAEALRIADAVQDIADQVSTGSLGEIDPLLPILDVLRAAARFDLGEHQVGLDAIRSAKVSAGCAATRTTSIPASSNRVS